MEDSRVCPICDTANPADALLCEVCGENLVPDDDAGEIGDQLSAEGEFVGFAVEDSDGDEEDIEFGATAASDATTDGMPAFEEGEVQAAPEFDEDEADADVTDEEMVMAAPADETAAMDSYAEEDDEDEFEGHGEVEATEVPSEAEAHFDSEAEFADDTGENEVEAEFVHEDTGETEFEPDYDEEGDDGEAEFDQDYDEDPEDASGEAEFDEEPAEDFDEEPADDDGPDYLYSPVDGTAFARGSAEYEEGFGPNGEELVATPPDAAFDALEAEIGGEVSGASMDDDELAAAAAPSPTVSAEFKAAFQAKPKQRPTMAPLPQPGSYVDPAVLTVYQNRQPVMRLAIDMDEVLIGRRDPVADAYPDLDLTDLDPEAHISRKHAYIYRQNKNYTLYAVSNAGTQLNADLLDLGDRRKLNDGDVIVLAGKIAMKFELPNA